MAGTIVAGGATGLAIARHKDKQALAKSEPPKRKRPTAAERKAYFAAHTEHDALIARHRAERDDWDRAEWHSYSAFLDRHGPSIDLRFHPLVKAKPKRKRKAAPKKIAKSEPLAIAGKLWRKPTIGSEFRRAYHGTRAGEKIVDHAARTRKMRVYRDPWGYTRAEPTRGHMGDEACAALHARTATEGASSPHQTGFTAGVKTGRAVAAAGRHPEYAISVPAVGAGAGLAHHEIKRAKKKKGTTVAKSAFGVEHEVIEKYTSGTITYHQNAADIHRRQRNSGRTQAAAGAVIGGAGVAAHQNAKRIAIEVGRRSQGPEERELGVYGPRAAQNIQRAYKGARHGGMGMAIGGGALLGIGAGRALHHGHMQNVESKRAQAARRQRNASIAGEVGKSAFGVELIDKNAVTEAFDTGIHALRGFKRGMGGTIGAERTAAGAAGKVAGAKTMGKLKPIGAAMTKTPQRTAATFGLGGIGVGMAANRN